MSVDSSGARPAFATKDVGATKTVTATGFALSGADKANYEIATVNTTTAAITKAGLTVTASGIDKPYDGSLAASVTLASDKAAGDTLTLSYTSASFADKDVGAAKPVSVDGIAVAGADAGNYDLLNTTAATTAAITKAGLTVSFTAADKPYDGTTSATITGASASGVVGSEDVSVDSSAASASFADKDVGATKTVTATGFALSGADKANYEIATVSTATAAITKAGLTVSFSAADKPYDGTTSATITGASASGVVGSEDVSVDSSAATAAFASKDVGATKTVTATGFALSGADKANYEIATVSTATAAITKAGLTVSFTAADKPYDGTTSATITGASDKGGHRLLQRRRQALRRHHRRHHHRRQRERRRRQRGRERRQLRATADLRHQGRGRTKTVTATGFALSGADKANYEIATVSTATAAITKAGLTVSFSAADKPYDGSLRHQGRRRTRRSPPRASP